MDQLMKLAVVVSVLDKLTGPVRKMAESMKGFERAAQRGMKVAEFGAKMGVAGVLVGDAAGRAKAALQGMMQPMVELEDRLGELRTVVTPASGSVVDAMGQMKSAAVDWSKNYSQRADQFVSASYMMSSAGLNHEQALAGTRTAMQVATATMGDQSTAANLLATIYNNLGNRSTSAATEMQRLGDITTKTQQMFQIKDLAQLNEGLKYAVPTAKQYRGEIEELYLVMGALNNAGLQGSMAGTAYSATMRNMMKASKSLGFEVARNSKGGIDFVATLENMRASLGPVSSMSDATTEKLKKAFGDEGVRSIVLLMDQTKLLKQQLGGIQGSAGVTATAFEQLEQRTSAKWRRIQNRMDAVKMSMAEKLVPHLEVLVPKIEAVIQKISEFIDKNPGLMRVAAAIGVIGTVALTVMAPILAIGGAIAILGGTAVTAVAKAISAVIVLGTKLKVLTTALWGVVRASAVWAKTVLVSVVGAIKAWVVGMGQLVAKGVMALLSVMGSLIASVWSFTVALLANPITWIVVGIAALIAAIVLLIVYWDAVKNAIVSAWQTAVDWTASAVGAVVGWFTGMGQAIGQVVSSVVEWFTGLPGKIAAVFQSALEWITGLGRRFWEAGKGLFGALVEGLKAAAGEVIDTVANTLSYVRDLLPFSDARRGPLSSLTKSGRSFWTTWAGDMSQDQPVRRTTEVLSRVRMLLPASEPKAGPLRGLAASGKAFWVTWMRGLNPAGAGTVDAVQSLGKDMAASLRPPTRILQQTQPGAPQSAGKEKREWHLHIGRLELPGVTDAKGFLSELRQAAAELGA
jgi:TP901 family phage tail tape measure protein